MHAIEWSDYLCPWCYLGLDRLDLLEELGVQVTCLPFELHPEIPREGRAIRADGRLAARLRRIGAECEAVGLPFSLPARMPNTRLALSAAEWVRRTDPVAFATLHRALFRAHFHEGADIGDVDVVWALVAAAGARVDDVAAAVARGDAGAAVNESMAQARDHGVTGTPGWLLDDRLLVPGVQPRETMERWVTRMQARAGS